MLLAPMVVGGGTDLPEVRHETAHLRIGTYFDDEVCAGSLAELEANTVWVADQLGVDVEDPIEVYGGQNGEYLGAASDPDSGVPGEPA